MFLPYFIAILLGFVNPSNSQNSCGGNTTVTVNSTNPDDNGGAPGDTNPDDGDDTGGEKGHVPPQ